MAVILTLSQWDTPLHRLLSTSPLNFVYTGWLSLVIPGDVRLNNCVAVAEVSTARSVPTTMLLPAAAHISWQTPPKSRRTLIPLRWGTLNRQTNKTGKKQQRRSLHNTANCRVYWSIFKTLVKVNSKFYQEFPCNLKLKGMLRWTYILLRSKTK